ncbi:MAG: beta-propeller domain-containing protein [Actinomycetes bacterium]
MGRVRRTTLILTSVAAVAIGGGTIVDAFTATTAHAADLPAFDSCAALRGWVDKAAAHEPRPGIAYSTRGGIAVNGSAGSAGAPAPQELAERAPVASKAADAVGTSATGTNVQEAGVDEPDQVKTDGHNIVSVGYGRGLWVAQLAGHTPHVIGRLRLDGDATSLLLAGNRALVLVSGPQAVPADGGPLMKEGLAGPGSGGPDIGIAPYDGRSRLEVVELSDPSNPHVIAREDITGSVLTARQIGNVAWVVTQSQPQIRMHPGSNVLPQRVVRNEHGVVVSKGDALPCTAMRHPIALSGSQMLTVQPVNITSMTPFNGHSAGVVANSGYVYASAKRLYVATNSWNSTANTNLHAFDISDSQRAAYVGSGSVRGTLLSQWAMSEQDGYLRVATTSGDVVPAAGEGEIPDPSHRSVTSVVVLAERGHRLAQVGRVTGLGRGERVWAVRFMGDVAAVVTFRQTDPLYLVDLSDPAHPALSGALELTGYSSYLHPVGNGLLLGVGREADSMGHVLNAKATLFDISDAAHPKRVANLDLGTGWSDLDGDAHAFTYLPDRHLALLPLQGDGSAATSISVDGNGLHRAGELTRVDTVQRFVPVGADVVALSADRLLDVDPVGLDVLGVAST